MGSEMCIRDRNVSPVLAQVPIWVAHEFLFTIWHVSFEQDSRVLYQYLTSTEVPTASPDGLAEHFLGRPYCVTQLRAGQLVVVCQAAPCNDRRQYLPRSSMPDVKGRLRYAKHNLRSRANSISTMSLWRTKEQKDGNIQQLAFARGHPPHYYSTGTQLIYGRANGIPSSLRPVAVCD